MRARAWVFVVNNWTEGECLKAQQLAQHCLYLVYGKEVGENGTPHLQGFCYFKHQRTGNIIQKHLPRAWKKESVDMYAAIAYSKKDGDFWESGREPKQGRRVDVEALRDDVKNGKRVDDDDDLIGEMAAIEQFLAHIRLDVEKKAMKDIQVEFHKNYIYEMLQEFLKGRAMTIDWYIMDKFLWTAYCEFNPHAFDAMRSQLKFFEGEPL